MWASKLTTYLDIHISISSSHCAILKIYRTFRRRCSKSLLMYEYYQTKRSLMAAILTYLYAAVDLAINHFISFLDTTQGLEPHLIRFWDFVWYTSVYLPHISFLLIVYAYSKPFVVAVGNKKCFPGWKDTLLIFSLEINWIAYKAIFLFDEIYLYVN